MGFDTLLYSLQERGHRILLAHPERSPAIQRSPELLEQFVSDGMLSSITAASLRGEFGGTVKRFTFELLERDLVHNVASDAHDARHRRPGIGDAFEAAEDELPGISERAKWMTVDVPKAILDGGPVPAPPGAPPRRRRRGLLRRVARSR
jgi:protein-tyrosine phosphatase